MLDKIDSVKKRFLADIENFPLEHDKITQLRSSYLGRKGEVADLFAQLGSLDSQIRPKIGQTLNKLKKELNAIFDKKIDEISRIQKNDEDSFVDLTLPGLVQRYGSLHVLEQTLQETNLPSALEVARRPPPAVKLTERVYLAVALDILVDVAPTRPAQRLALHELLHPARRVASTQAGGGD